MALQTVAERGTHRSRSHVWPIAPPDTSPTTGVKEEVGDATHADGVHRHWRGRARGRRTRGHTPISGFSQVILLEQQQAEERFQRAISANSIGRFSLHGEPGPGRLTGYAAQFLPAIADAITEGDAATANRYRDLVLESLERATELANRPGV